MSTDPELLARLDVDEELDKTSGITPGHPAAQAGELVCFIVEDEPAIQNLIAAAITPIGVKVEMFRNATSALAGIYKTRPHLVFLDASLDGSDAVEVMRGLGAAHFRGKVQLISGSDTEVLNDLRLVGERHELGMLPPLRKPFRASTIRQLVQDNFAELMQDTPRKAASFNPTYQKLQLDEVLRNNWIQLWYQPKIDLQNMKPAGVEGLARCVHPVFGLVMPGSFLPGAEEPTMAKLAERQLIRALSDWPAFDDAGFPFKISINMSVATLVKLPIAQIVREHRPKSDRWPGMIIEITEDQAIQDIHLIHEIATQLRLYKISIAIDDFGAGYSHLARLKELPFSELKLDRSLVSNCGEDAEAASLSRMAIELAHKFGKLAVADGVEKSSEAQTLRSMGCDIAQGFLFAPAVQRDKLITAMKKRIAAAS
ncbi:MAG: EAL domain-containing response regulator [Xanthobacteraceae bacterium]|nr:EAL domain-containing response regulator [Xanthobacteraceae bacterium]QYK44608.1 MAG: EAL domain-containing response regulator [Xanthobacteraceae bacterium]